MAIDSHQIFEVNTCILTYSITGVQYYLFEISQRVPMFTCGVEQIIKNTQKSRNDCRASRL